MLLRLVLLEMFCKIAYSSVFLIFCFEIANLHGVTLDQDRKSRLWLGSLLELRTELRLKSYHYMGTQTTSRSI